MEDVSHFDEKITSETPNLSMHRCLCPLSDEKQMLFMDFNYTANWDQPNG